MKKNKRIFNIITTSVITAIFILLGVSKFQISYLRLIESLGDLLSSCRFYLFEILKIPHNTVPMVESYSQVLKWDSLLPPDLKTFKAQASYYFVLLFSSENFNAWGNAIAKNVGGVAKFIVIILPCLLISLFVVKKLYSSGNNFHNRDTIPLKIFKFIMNVTYQPLKSFILSYKWFLIKNKKILVFWSLMWTLHLNFATIIIEFLAYYLYFAVSYRFDSLYVQFVKLFIDLQVIIRNFPWWALSIPAWLLFDRFRQRIALGKLRHYEARNCGFINELPIVSITCGSMGKKKTTMITDMTLSQEVMFRQKALNILQTNDMKFPHFPWICFEMELRKCIEHGAVYNLATVKEWINKKRERFEKHGSSKLQLYGYDYEKYGFTYDDGLKTEDLFDVLKTYASAYFVYIIQSSLIVSNYSIRTDNVLLDECNFPLWLHDFFPKNYSSNNRYAKILDFDILRLGKKVIGNNPNAGSFEFGVIAISEIGKERGNNLELREVKKGTHETNQKNDLFNSWLKMCRHSATVDHYPFIKVFTDEQRPESWGADARDLCEIIHIVSSGDQRLALPFYTIEEMISEWAFDKFINLYYDFRFRRGDNTLLVHLLKGITAFLFKRNVRIHNRFGYSILKIEKQCGTMDGRAENKRYYIMNRKICSKRFSSDCFSDYFNEMAKKSKIGLNDYLEYMTEKATVSELKKQNSYFIRTLYSGADTDTGD